MSGLGFELDTTLYMHRQTRNEEIYNITSMTT